jgi:hypothetical protein
LAKYTIYDTVYSKIPDENKPKENEICILINYAYLNDSNVFKEHPQYIVARSNKEGIPAKLGLFYDITHAELFANAL